MSASPPASAAQQASAVPADPAQALKLTAEAASSTTSEWPIISALLVALVLGGLGMTIRRRRI